MCILYILFVSLSFQIVLSDTKCDSKNNKFCKLPRCCNSRLNATDASCIKISYCTVVKSYYIPKEGLSTLIDVDDGISYNNISYKFGAYCLSEELYKSTYVLKVCYKKEYCTQRNKNSNGVFCLKKCCPHRQILTKNHMGKVECVHDDVIGVNITSYSENIIRGNAADIVLIHDNINCPKYIANYTKHKFYFVQNGSMFIEETGSLNEYTINQQKYCLENYRGRSEVFVCAYTNKNQTKFKYSRPIMVFSCVCLFLAMLRFMFCFKTMKLMQRMLILFCCSQFVSFGIISLLQFGFLIPNKSGCRFVGFTHLFASLAAFLWMNVISFSAWKTLRSTNTKTNMDKFNHKRFFIYNCYVWGVAGMITTFCYLDNCYNILPSVFHPYLGKTRCILEHSFKDANYGYIIYFTLPTGIIIATNMIFCSLTVVYFVNVKVGIVRKDSARNGIHAQSKSILHDTFKIALKLFILMGCTWLFEVISTLYDFKQSYTLKRIEVLMDTVNSLQGFLLLIIFDFRGIIRLFSFCKTYHVKQITSGTVVTL